MPNPFTTDRSSSTRHEELVVEWSEERLAVVAGGGHVMLGRCDDHFAVFGHPAAHPRCEQAVGSLAPTLLANEARRRRLPPHRRRVHA
jgi:hypothetical protein